MKSEMRQARDLGLRVVFVDEAMFTTAILMKTAYSSLGSNHKIKEKAVSAPALAVIGGVSEENGLDSWLITPRSAKSEDFIVFLQKILAKYPSERIAIFLDKCSVHHSKKVKAFIKESYINVPYSP
jgi:hypothetical protein